jgi:hypothetical protein
MANPGTDAGAERLPGKKLLLKNLAPFTRIFI